jgi:hypothetical protein
MNVMEKGPLIRISNKEKRDKEGRCATFFKRTASAISLEKIFTIFMFLLFAGVVSLCLLIIEMLNVKLFSPLVF